MSKPPFATATLARLYLAQGHVDMARSIVQEAEKKGAPGTAEVRAQLAGDLERRTQVLEDLLEAVRRRRQTRRPGAGAGDQR